MLNTMIETMIMLAIIMSLGYYLQKRGVLNDNVRTNLTFILLRVSLPLTFFMSFQVTKSEELLSYAKDIIILSIILHSLFLVLGYFVSKIVKADKSEAGVVVFGTTFKNLTFLGFPMVVALFTDYEASFYGTLFCIPFNILTFTLGPIILPAHRNNKIYFKDFLTPINISIFIGIIFFAFELRVPYAIENAFRTIASMTIPVSLLLTGALLTKSDFRTIFKEPKVLFVAFVNLIVFPLVFLFIAKLFNFNTFALQFSFVMALLPSASMTLILTDKYDGNIDFAGKIVLLTTILSLFTVVFLGGVFL